jgi:hypothetical protein
MLICNELISFIYLPLNHTIIILLTRRRPLMCPHRQCNGDIEQVGFYCDFGQTEMDWYGRSWFWTSCNGLVWKKLVLNFLQWIGLGKYGYGLSIHSSYSKILFVYTVPVRTEYETNFLHA